MILRRVIGHFRKQEWAAIAIDFLIVVFGVFVGLQVNNWNEARKDRRDERFMSLKGRAARRESGMSAMSTAMRNDRAFLTVLSGNAQRYDAYVRVYLEPWAAQFETVRRLVDGALGVDHSK